MYTSAEFIAAFDAEAGDVATLAGGSRTKLLWFNQGQSRLLSFDVKVATLSWTAAATSIALPTDFVQPREIEYDPANSCRDQWEVLSQRALTYVTRDGDFTLGAAAAGSLRIKYDSEWANLLNGSGTSDLSQAGDTACLMYALHRFYRLLASNRAYYKRYATLVGANAVSVSDLQAEADRYLQDFTDARADLTPAEPSYAYRY